MARMPFALRTAAGSVRCRTATRALEELNALLVLGLPVEILDRVEGAVTMRDLRVAAAIEAFGLDGPYAPRN